MILNSDASLYYERNVYVRATDSAAVETEELGTPVSPYLLHDVPFEFGDGVTVGILCRYLMKDLDYWNGVIGNGLKDYVETCGLPRLHQHFDDGVTPLHAILEWSLGCDRWDGKRHLSLPSVSFSVMCRVDKGHGHALDGDVRYGFSGIYMSDIKDLPLVIDRKAVLSYDNLDRFFFEKEITLADMFGETKGFRKWCPRIYSFWRRLILSLKHREYDFGTMDMSLFQALYGIFWELSFYGSPDDRIEFFKKLEQDHLDFIESDGKHVEVLKKI